MAPAPDLRLWHGLGGSGEPPDRCRAAVPLLLLGGGRTVWSDYDRVRPWSGHVMAVNDIGAFLQVPIQHWASLHPEYFAGWLAYRRGHCHPDQPFKTHAARPEAAVDRVWPIAGFGPDSGLFGVLIALVMGYPRVVLAGVPMTGNGHFFDPPWQDGGPANDVVNWTPWWRARDEIFAGRVKSLSGNTRDWLGEP